MKDLCKLLSYDPETGNIFWEKPNGFKTKKGDIAGCVGTKGYINIYYNKRCYSAHRVAAMMGGMDIDGMDIDHINGKRTDNRLVNLRAVSRAVNLKNKRPQSNNTTGVTGLTYRKNKKAYCVSIRVNGEYIYLGHYKDKWLAICARMSANAKYKFHLNHGRTPR